VFTLRVRLITLFLLVALAALTVGFLAAQRESAWSAVAVLLFSGAALLYLDRGVLRPLQRDLDRRNQTTGEVRRHADEVEELYNQAPCGYHSLDAEGRFVHINDTALAWLGYRRDEVLGRSVRDFLTPAGQRLFDAHFEEFKARGWARDLEQQLLRKDGTVLYALLSTVARRDEQGRYVASRSAYVDITQRKKYEECLAEVSLRLQAVLDAATEVAVIATDLEGRITLFNAGAERMLGYRANEMLGRQTPWKIDPTAAAHPSSFILHPSAFGSVERARYGGHEDREWTFVRKDGSHLTVSLVVTAVNNSDGRISGFLGIATDVTERNRSRARLEMTMTAAHLGTWEWDLGSDRVKWSDNVHEVLGLPVGLGEQPFARFLDLVAVEDRDHVRAAVHAALNDPQKHDRYEAEFRIPGADGEVRWLEDKGRVFRDAQGRPTHMLGTLMDVTPRRHSAELLQKARDAAESANRAKSSFLASMSHEIRTPLAAIVGMVELMQQGYPSDEQRAQLHTLGTAAESLLSLINDILDVSKIEAGKLELEARPFELRALVSDVVGVLSVPARRKRLPLVVEVDSSLPTTLVGDAGRLRQVLLNLVGNAVKFTAAGEVALRVEAAHGSSYGQVWSLRFTVQDTGVGIADDKLERIFQPFEQADESTTRTHGGTGLGLTISARLVERMGGRLTVCSEVGRGSTFSFQVRLPVAAEAGALAAAAVVAPTAAGALVAPAGAPSWVGRGLHVLLVEDTPVNQQVLTLLLRKAGHQVTVVDNGRKALEATGRETFDLVLMDVQMPEMDGLRCSRLIRAHEKAVGGHVPIVAVTANALQGERQRCLQAGMDDYLTKPVRSQELFGVIERLFGRHGPAAPALVGPAPAWLAPLREMGFDDGAVSSLLRTFVEAVPGRLEALATGVGAGDLAAVAREAHKVKGSLTVFAVQPAIDAAARLEHLADEGQHGPLAGALADLEAAVEPLLASMRERLRGID
jgi:PAS domain S-box-containing protein